MGIVADNAVNELNVFRIFIIVLESDIQFVPKLDEEPILYITEFRIGEKLAPNILNDKDPVVTLRLSKQPDKNGEL